MLKRQKSVTSSSNTGNLALSIAVVICTHNRPALLDRCLRGLQQVDNPDFSIVVVDSAPNSCETKSVATRYGAQYNISPLKGLSRARNIGIGATDADIVAFIDDDMVPHARWLNSLIAEFADKNVVVATGPMLSFALVDGSNVDLRLAVELAPWGAHRFQVDKNSRQWFERTNFGGVGDGNFALRRSAFDQIRGFDERLGRGAAIDSGEEHYAFFRFVALGFKIAYAPQAVVFHSGSLTSHDVLRKKVADAVAYAAFLAWNHPSKSWRIFKFFIEGIFIVRRWWHTSWKYQVISMPAREKIRSGINGLFIFVQSMRRARTHPR
jgi:GT2 family glycosyltransferase